MLLTLELATRGFVSAFEEEEYELTKIFERESDTEVVVDDDENEERENSNIHPYPEDGREIFDDEDDSGMIREYF